MKLFKFKDETVKINNDQQVYRNLKLFIIIFILIRKLYKQISVIFNNLLYYIYWIIAGTVINRKKKKSEKAKLKKGLNILITTLKHLINHFKNIKILNINNVRWLILNKRNKLMKLGFKKDIQKIITKLKN